MAERFGDHILLADGALDRGAVAAIVFNDEAALKDLNGIVHPAMQDEIQRQIDVHRGTDRVVVLDFPLLGENPRKGLVATIVVDIPVDVAVQRLVDQRGMDEADARARINSQISREERLATATHVIDNGGDRDSLIEQVDALWADAERAAARHVPTLPILTRGVTRSSPAPARPAPGWPRSWSSGRRRGRRTPG